MLATLDDPPAARGDLLEAAAALRQVVVGTLLTDPILLTLRRVADEGVSLRRS